jgi:hypothetical protein
LERIRFKSPLEISGGDLLSVSRRDFQFGGEQAKREIDAAASHFLVLE